MIARLFQTLTGAAVLGAAALTFSAPLASAHTMDRHWQPHSDYRAVIPHRHQPPIVHGRPYMSPHVHRHPHGRPHFVYRAPQPQHYWR